MTTQNKLARAWFAWLHNCVAHPLLFWTSNANWAVSLHDWTATKWLGETNEQRQPQPPTQNTQDAEVYAEIDRATAKFPTWPTDPLHAVSVLGEEYGELVKAVLQHAYEPRKSELSDVREEAIQTAAMALRFVRSIDQYEFTRCKQHSQHGAP